MLIFSINYNFSWHSNSAFIAWFSWGTNPTWRTSFSSISSISWGTLEIVSY